MGGFIGWLASGAIAPFLDLGKSIVGIFLKKEDTKVEQGKDDVAVIQSRNSLLSIIHNDPAIATGWYMFIVPTGLWYIGIIVYCLVHPWYPSWKVVLALPPNIEYIPWAIVAFLFGLSWRGRT